MFFSMFFELGPALQKLFELGFELREDDFEEFTSEEYAFIEEKGEDINKKWYVLVAKDPGPPRDFDMVADEDDLKALLDAVALVHRYCEDSASELKTFKEKLLYAAGKLPPVFSRGTPFFRANLKVIDGSNADK